MVQIDFNGIDASDAETLEKSLLNTLDEIARQHEIELSYDLLTNKFVELFAELHKKYRKDIVVLIDEYDKPVITHLGKGELDLRIAQKNRDILGMFLGVLKSIATLRLVFITGISRFNFTNMFSGLNNLQNLSMYRDYAELLGFTEAEVEQYFKPFVSTLAEENGLSYNDCLERMKTWYHGYRFATTKSKLYNPFSILHALKNRSFKNFWFESGSPNFLVNLIEEKNYSIPDIENLQVRETTLSGYELEKLNLEALLFQSGYITIHDDDGILFHLGYPNQEVKTAFLSFIYHNLVKIADTTLQAQFSRLHQYLAQEGLEQFIETTNAILAAIPYTQIRGQATPEGNEQYYHTVFYLMVAASGVLVHTEPLSSHGRMDIAVEFKDKVYVIELKCNQSADAAIQQIHAKRYHEKYLQSGRRIHLMGINFSTTERRIVDWRMETIGS